MQLGLLALQGRELRGELLVPLVQLAGASFRRAQPHLGGSAGGEELGLDPAGGAVLSGSYNFV